MFDLHLILHPTDFSASSEQAFRLACTLAQSCGARVRILHVARQPVVVPTGRVAPSEPEHYREVLTDKLCSLQQRYPELEIEAHLVFAADPAGRIIQEARDHKPDVIVMGTHGRTGLGRLLMGSVAEHVVRKAPCPVVTVKLPVPASSAVVVPEDVEVLPLV
jgi:nucleotide-binding universal stress UspA family protein